MLPIIPPTTGSNILSGTALKTVYVTDENVISRYQEETLWNNYEIKTLKSVYIAPLLFRIDPSTRTAGVISCAKSISSSSYEIPESIIVDDEIYTVTSLGSGCFRGNNISAITIPNTVTSIEPYCFEGTYLSSITIPNSVKCLGASCFKGCNTLRTITLPNSLLCLGDSCFTDCRGLTAINIPSSVTSLGVSCFSTCI